MAGLLLLRFAGSSDPAIAGRASMALVTWERRCTNVFTAPARRQVDQFEELLGRAHLDEKVRARLRMLAQVLSKRCR
ncbi:MAG: hypothetical protein QM767_26795 [Anaeromyxobacter sp.]